MAQSIGKFAANHLGAIETTLGIGLRLVSAVHWLLGNKLMSTIAKGLHYGTGQTIPLWTPAMPRATRRPKTKKNSQSNNSSFLTPHSSLLKVVYFPSCINQTMGVAKHDPDQTPLMQKTVQLLEKAGYEVIFPENMKNLCCGTIWESKGMPELADQKSAELEKALLKATDNGKYPVLCDQSPCLHRMRETIKKMKLYEPAEFIYTFLRDKLEFTQTNRPVAIHITCSMRKMGLANTLISLAKLCSTNVLVPEEVGCCGFAGDRGFTHPELNAYALRKLRPQIKEKNIQIGYSNSRTCEIGLTTNSGIPYVSIAYLVDECTTAKKQ